MTEEEDSCAIAMLRSEIPNLRLGTLGPALIAVMKRISRSGVQIMSKPVGLDENAKVANVVPQVFVRHVNILVGSAINQAMMYGTATKDSVGSSKNYAQNVFKQGNVIALYNIHNGCFLRIHDNKVDFGGGKCLVNNLPLAWDSERFLVVALDEDCKQFALYSLSHYSFLQIDKSGKFCASAPAFLHDSPRVTEIFSLKDVVKKMGKTFHLHNEFSNRSAGESYIGAVGDSYRVVQVQGLDY
jgi:hypothetical protein